MQKNLHSSKNTIKNQPTITIRFWFKWFNSCSS